MSHLRVEYLSKRLERAHSFRVQNINLGFFEFFHSKSVKQYQNKAAPLRPRTICYPIESRPEKFFEDARTRTRDLSTHAYSFFLLPFLRRVFEWNGICSPASRTKLSGLFRLRKSKNSIKIRVPGSNEREHGLCFLLRVIVSPKEIFSNV